MRMRSDSIKKLEQLGARIGSEEYAELLRACSNLSEGKRIHAHLIERGGENVDRFLGNLLVEMYGRCGSISSASLAFESIRRKNIFTWNIMIGACCTNGFSSQALELFGRMERDQIEASNVTYVILLGACSHLRDIARGREIHSRIIESEFHTQTIVANSLINMYGKCGSIAEARQVFDQIPCRNVISWNSIIAANARNGHCLEALKLFHQMIPLGLKHTRATFLNALEACWMQGEITQGRIIHSRILEAGIQSDIQISNTLLNMYSKCGRLDEAEMIFQSSPVRNVISWTAMITAYAQHGYGNQSIHLYRLMDLNGVFPDEITLISVLDACSSIKALEVGLEVHRLALSFGAEQHLILATALVNMYGECGELELAEKAFESMTERSIVTWNTMIAAFARNGHPERALELYHSLDQKPNEVTFANAVEACGNLSDLKQGREIHRRAVDLGFDKANVLGSTLVDLYGRCGSLREARQAFSSMSRRDTISWTSMVSAYSHHGWGDEALELFSEMNLDGVSPNPVSFLCVLSACGHSGLLKTARQHFIAMGMDYGLASGIDHYYCLVDVLGRAGKLEAAEELIQSMPFQPGPVVWMMFLSASKTIGDFQGGERAAENMLKLEPDNPSTYLVFSSIYSEASQYDFFSQDEVLEKVS